MSRYNKNSPKWISWCTPQYIIDAIEKVIGPIYLDPCACKDRPDGLIGRVINWFGSGPIDDSGLTQSWGYRVNGVLQLVFCNSPYGVELKTWCNKAAFESSFVFKVPILLLCPPRMGSQWWHKEVLKASGLSGIFFFNGRLQFDNPPPVEEGQEQKKDQNDSDSCLVAYNIADEKMLELEKILDGVYMKRVK